MQRIRFLNFIVPLLLSVFVSDHSFAQEYKSFRSEYQEIREQTIWRVGPFRLFPTIQFKDVGYDNNVYYQREGENPASDFTGTFSPQIKMFVLISGSLILSFTENPEYVFYFEQKRERRWNNSLSPDFKFLLFNRFILSGKYYKSNRRRRASSEFDIRANEIREGYRGGLFYDTGWKTSFGISVLSEKISYEDIALPGTEMYLSRSLNREETGGFIEFYHRILTRSSFFVRGGYTEYRFEHAGSRWRDSRSFHASCGIHFPLMEKINGTLSLGYKKLMPRVKNKKGFAGLIGDTSLSFRLWNFSFRVNYRRDCHFSYWTNNIYFNENRYGAGMSVYLMKFLRLDYSFSYGEADYPERISIQVTDSNVTEILRKDIYRIHTAGLVFRIFKRTGIGVRVNLWSRETNYFWENRDRMFIGGYITSSF
jgi:hypothetical protein